MDKVAISGNSSFLRDPFGISIVSEWTKSALDSINAKTERTLSRKVVSRSLWVWKLDKERAPTYKIPNPTIFFF